jgi:glycosyltransferase involved in cell wall biosynthesis
LNPASTRRERRQKGQPVPKGSRQLLKPDEGEAQPRLHPLADHAQADGKRRDALIRMSNRRYVLITAARNEERFIEETLASVAAQTLRPVRWVVVSDASTDRTDEIVRGYAERFEFIELLRLDGKHARNFGAQVDAINAGYERLKDLDFRYVGNLDADISLDPDYFEKLLSKFEEDPCLGIAGGAIHENWNGEFAPRPTNSVRSVAHAVQFMRRECYDGIGGYIPFPYGGPDWAAEVMARMRGWRVQTFPDLPAFHHRQTGAAGGVVRYMFRQGLMDFSFGSHPAFEVAKCIRRMRHHPIGAAARLLGFAWADLSGKQRLVSRKFIEFLRSEQKARLRVFPAAASERSEERVAGIQPGSVAGVPDSRRPAASVARPGAGSSS